MQFTKYIMLLPFLFIFFAKADTERDEFFESLQIKPSKNVALKSAQSLLKIMLIDEHKSLSIDKKKEIIKYFRDELDEEDAYFAKIIKLCLTKIERALPLTKGQTIIQAFEFLPEQRVNLDEQFFFQYLSEIVGWINNKEYKILQEESTKIAAFLTSLYNAQRYNEENQVQLFIMVNSSLKKYYEQSIYDHLISSSYFNKLAMRHFDSYALARLYEISQDMKNTLDKPYIEQSIDKLEPLCLLLLRRNIGVQKSIKNGIAIIKDRERNAIKQIDVISELRVLSSIILEQSIKNEQARKLYVSFINVIDMLEMYKMYKYRHTANGRTKRFQRLFNAAIYEPLINFIDATARVQMGFLMFFIFPALLFSIIFNVHTNIHPLI